MSWSHTLNLPRSKLANRSNANLIAKNLPKITKDLYQWQNSQSDRPEFTLHDGPPYANGDLHMGHALNKVLKDLVTRFSVLNGYKVDYRPGFDCHGLPIEHAAAKHSKPSENGGLTANRRRSLAKQWAMKMVKRQQQSFQSYGVMADWGNPDNSYRTLDSTYVARELQVFADLVAKKLIFRQRKPVFWSVESETALAESELVYGTRESTAVFLMYPMKNMPDMLAYKVKQKIGDSSTNLLVWTTTPWTLPSNQAIAINRDLEYALVMSNSEYFWCAKDLVENLQSQGVLGTDSSVVLVIKGSELVNCEYECPLRHSKHYVYPAEYVTNDAGTGLVHTAPGHGKEDYGLGLQLNLPVVSPIDGQGRYTNETQISSLVGLDARTAGQSVVLELLGRFLIFKHNIAHSVPLDWRTKTPVMVRATPQFFMDLGPEVRGKALKAIEDVEFKPESGKKRLIAFTESRSDWCISRQRPWGVPIPVLYNKKTDEALMTAESIDHIMNQIRNLGESGLKKWFSPDTVEDVEFWLPPSMKDRGLGIQYRKCTDTLDVWLDSGSSWSMMNKTPADIYLEGSDQHRGWFQSSLLLHVAVKGQPVAPFKRLVTHGFVLDEHRQKMSKSIGNTVEPQQVIDQIGVDGLRLLVAQSDYTSDISLNTTATQQVAAMIKKFRLTFKYLLGNLHQFDEVTIHAAKLSDLDRYALVKLNKLIAETHLAYTEQNFPAVVKLVQTHMNTDLSAVYFDAVKDTLYADHADSLERLGVQTVLWHILNAYIRMLSPILPFLTQEVWDMCPPTLTSGKWSPLMTRYPQAVNIDNSDLHSALERVQLALSIRPLVNNVVEKARSEGLVGSSLGVDISIETAHPAIAQLPTELLKTLFIVSEVRVNSPVLSPNWCFGIESENQLVKVVASPAQSHKCPRCWKYAAPVENQLCRRCEDAVGSV